MPKDIFGFELKLGDLILFVPAGYQAFYPAIVNKINNKHNTIGYISYFKKEILDATQSWDLPCIKINPTLLSRLDNKTFISEEIKEESLVELKKEYEELNGSAADWIDC